MILLAQAEIAHKFANERLPIVFTAFEKLLSGNNGGNSYFVGDKVIR